MSRVPFRTPRELPAGEIEAGALGSRRCCPRPGPWWGLERWGTPRLGPVAGVQPVARFALPAQLLPGFLA